MRMITILLQQEHRLVCLSVIGKYEQDTPLAIIEK
jgi:hypothetical protein